MRHRKFVCHGVRSRSVDTSWTLSHCHRLVSGGASKDHRDGVNDRVVSQSSVFALQLHLHCQATDVGQQCHCLRVRVEIAVGSRRANLCLVDVVATSFLRDVR